MFYKECDICYEICGDGFNMYQYECDDGNLNNYDGCNDQCEVENGWQCAGGTPATKDTCWRLVRPYVVSAYINPKNELITVNFNEPLLLDAGWEQSNFDMYIEGTWTPYNFTFKMLYEDELKKNANSSFIFEIEIKDQIRGRGADILHL